MPIESDTENNAIGEGDEAVSSNINAGILAPYLAQIEKDELSLLERLWADLHSAKNEVESVDTETLDAYELKSYEEIMRITAGFLHFVIMATIANEDQARINATILASLSFQIDCHVSEIKEGFRRGANAQGGARKTVQIN